MRSNLFLFVFLFFLGSLQAQENINLSLVSSYDYSEACNDVWGYVASDGTEYAILGTVDATAVISLEDPADPVEVAYIPGANSIWRDMKSWGDHVYVTTDDGTDGLLIIDMSGAPDNITSEYVYLDFTINGTTRTMGKCHNIYIDENGFAYLSGCDDVNDSRINNGGVVILDVHTTPGVPVHVGQGRAAYSHDNFVRGDTLWSSDINAGVFSVQDVSVKNNASTWTTESTTTNFTHNAWLSDDGDYLFTTDEKPNAFVDAYDVSDLNEVELMDSYQPKATKGKGVIPHNTHYEDGFLITSWYTDGIVVIDGSKPDNLVQVAAYDTYLGGDGGFSGCWGAYPYLPSGLILASDIQSGLIVLEPSYIRACYLEGEIISEFDGTPINNVTVEVQDFIEAGTNTDFQGVYKTGYATAGTYMVEFSKSGYYSKTLEATLTNGVVTTLDAELEPKNILDLKVINADTGLPVPNSKVRLFNNTDEFDTATGMDGESSIAFLEGDFTVYAGAWGFMENAFDLTYVSGMDQVEIELTPGYKDDFVLDLGWESINVDASTGTWERGTPIATTFGGGFSNVNEDIDSDLGEECYMTANGGGGAGDADVDGGTVILNSPLMDLSDYEEAEISFYTWFVNGGGNGNPDDSLIVSINNGVDEKVIEIITESEGAWRPQTKFKVSDYLPLTDAVYMTFRTMDLGAGHLVEAGVDAFLVEGTIKTVGINEFENLQAELAAYPNPFNNSFTLEYQMEASEKDAQVMVYNMLGQEIYSQRLDATTGTLNLGTTFDKGLYFVMIASDKQQSSVVKIVKE